VRCFIYTNTSSMYFYTYGAGFPVLLLIQIELLEFLSERDYVFSRGE